MTRVLFALWYWPVFFVLTVGAGFICLLVSLFSRTASRFITSQVWAAIVFWPAAIKVTIKGQENLPQTGGYIIFANHRSLLDIPTVAVAVNKPISWVAKAALGRIPVFGWTLKRSHMLVDRGGGADAAKKMVAEAQERLKNGEILAIFPEGTRNKTATPVLAFKKGAFILAKRATAPLIPIAIHHSSELWPAGGWLPKTGTLTAAIGQPLTPVANESLGQLAVRAQKILEELYLTPLTGLESLDGLDGLEGPPQNAPNGPSSLGPADHRLANPTADRPNDQPADQPDSLPDDPIDPQPNH
ncbi:MAG: 1-acyl-sn-glycerol-3-phosphate acyltransferase [Deltaproteobacteria bacterium]|jgi:1-acyl-sn-glycerol-3-phosphate acyltransferase|nr:1-acyl-sn-glycerol-3-phosphate acyltransferase [Deltaproteobacteria bacterium]